MDVAPPHDLVLVLDMDGTLIADLELAAFNPQTVVTPRPHLADFLRFAFTHFRCVGIWTAAGRGWYDHVHARVFQPILDSIRIPALPSAAALATDAKSNTGSTAPSGDARRFAFVWCGDRCSHVPQRFCGDDFNSAYGAARKFKKLSKLWRRNANSRRLYAGATAGDAPASVSGRINRHNTLILDDTPSTYHLNYGNAIRIPTFSVPADGDGDGDGDDHHLRTLMEMLRTKWFVAYGAQLQSYADALALPLSVLEVIHSYSPLRSVHQLASKMEWWQ